MSILSTWLTFGCGQSSVNDKVVVDVTRFEQLTNASNQKMILDVRTLEEFADGYIPGACLINVYDDNFKDKNNELDKSKSIFVYCAAGIRSEGHRKY